MRVPTLEDHKGKKSWTFTMVVLSFGAVFLWLLFWLIGTSFHLPVPPFDASEAMIFLSPMFALYFGRKGQKIKTGEDSGKGEGLPNDSDR